MSQILACRSAFPVYLAGSVITVTLMAPAFVAWARNAWKNRQK